MKRFKVSDDLLVASIRLLALMRVFRPPVVVQLLEHEQRSHQRSSLGRAFGLAANSGFDGEQQRVSRHRLRLEGSVGKEVLDSRFYLTQLIVQARVVGIPCE